jgi:uncharacterized membrane protein YsdA (DUF1294 family)
MARKVPSRNKGSLATSLYAIVAIGLVIILYAFIFPATEWPGYVVWLIAWSAATFALYGLDKGLAAIQSLRVPEIVLHVAALVGGFAGGWLGMLVWRHKIRDQVFYVVLLVATLIHGGIIYYTYFYSGSNPFL